MASRVFRGRAAFCLSKVPEFCPESRGANFFQTVRKLLSKIGVSVRPAGDGGFRAI
jgi:hypothetical protein